MPRFHFRLQPLVSVRHAERDQRRARLADALATDRALASDETAARQALRDEQDHLRRQTTPGRVNATALAAAERYAAGLRRQLATLAERRATLAPEIERRRQAVVEADRELRVLEKLSERQQTQFKMDQSRAEGKLLDEAAARTSAVLRLDANEPR
jgi:flagellar FliJ protein